MGLRKEQDERGLVPDYALSRHYTGASFMPYDRHDEKIVEEKVALCEKSAAFTQTSEKVTIICHNGEQTPTKNPSNKEPRS